MSCNFRWLTTSFHGKRGALGRGASLVIVSNFLTVVAFSNVIGTDMQNFNPTPDGLDFVTVYSSETLEPGFFNFGLFLNYATNTLPYFDDDSFQSRENVNDTLWSADFSVGLGLLPNWQVGLSMPHVISQYIDYNGRGGRFSQNGITEVRLMSKYRFWGDATQGVAGVFSVNFNQVSTNPYTGQGSKPIYNFEITGDKTFFSKLAVGLNLGYRHRQPGEPLVEAQPILPVKSQYVASTAASWHIPEIDSKIIFEIYTSRPVAYNDNDYSNRLAASSEAILGIKYDFDHHVSTHLGGGTELIHGQSSSDWRGYAGVNYQYGPTWTGNNRVDEIKEQQTISPANFDQPHQDIEKFVVHNVHFKFDSDHLVLPNTKSELDKLAARAREGKGFKKIEIIGHTDSVGSAEYNLDLSRRRAETVKRWLVEKHGYPADGVVALGKGSSEPIADNSNYQGRQKNRRVEFNIIRE